MSEEEEKKPILEELLQELGLRFDQLAKEAKEGLAPAETISVQNGIITLLRVLCRAGDISSEAMPEVVRRLQELATRKGVSWSAAHAHTKHVLAEFEEQLEKKEEAAVPAQQTA